MRVRRLILIASAVAAMSLCSLAAPAAASSSADRSTAASLSCSLRTVTGINSRVMVAVTGCGLYVDHVTVSKVDYVAPYTGHHDILLPVSPYRVNGVNGWGPPQVRYYPRRNMPNYSKICGEGWTYRSGHWDLTGRPCLTIHS
jgi:hypothetical protein